MKSEFAELSDIALSGGYSHSELISQIHATVLSEYRKRFPDAPIGVAVFIDELSGTVRIFSGDKDVTPDGFGQEAASLARQVLIGKIKKHPTPASGTPAPQSKTEKPAPFQKRTKIAPLLTNLIFWGYNIYFQLFALFFGLSYIWSARSQNTPWTSFFVSGLFRPGCALLLILLPALSMFIAARWKLYTRPDALAKLFFLLELPLAVIITISFFTLPATTPFMLLVIVLFLLIPPVILLHESNIRVTRFVQPVLLTITLFILIMYTYILTLFLFYLPVIIAAVAQLLFSDIAYRMSGMYARPEYLIDVFIQLSLGMLIFLIILGLMAIPFLVFWLLLKAFNKSYSAVRETMSEEKTLKLQLVGAGVFLLCAAILAYQPGTGVLLQKLEQITKKETFSEKEALARDIIPHQAEARQAIRELSSGYSRYPYHTASSDLKYAYESIFNLNDDMAEFIQRMFLITAYPFVFQADRSGSTTASSGYQYVFGTSPFTDETETPKPPPENQTGSVLLSYRSITVTPASSPLLATVTIEEEYDNTTWQQHEVIYEMNLPPGAVFADLKLGPNLEYPGIIAPKGAAQRTYENELNRRRDPALLEQTGPRQYRLRVFPIPAKNDLTTLAGKRQKIQYTYITPISKNGYPLPRFTKKSNLFVNNTTRLSALVDGKDTKLKETDTEIAFAPGRETKICDSASPLTVSRDAHSATITTVASTSSGKAAACGSIKEALSQINKRTLAIFVDVSRQPDSEKQTEALIKLLKDNTEFLAQNTVDIYKFNDTVSAETNLTPDTVKNLKLTYFGTQADFKAFSRLEKTYDTALVLVGKSARITNQTLFPFNPTTHVIFIHPDDIPPYTMEFTSKLLQSRGDTVSSLEEAFRIVSLKQSLELPQPNTEATYLNTYILVTLTGLPTNTSEFPNPLTPDSPQSSVANKVLTNALIARYPRDITGDVSVMDRLHQLAVTAKTVTPYSSLLSLVNEEQRRLLEQFNNRYDRFLDQQPTENATWSPRPLPGIAEMNLPSFDGMARSGSSLPAPGSLNIMPPTAGGGSDLDIGTRVHGGSQMINITSLTSPLVLFILLNGLLLGGGLSLYLWQTVRKKKQN